MTTTTTTTTTPDPDQDEDGRAPPPQVPTSAFYEAAGAAYEEAYGQNAGLLGALSRYAARLPAGAAVLDLGSGTGRPVAAALAVRGLRVHGVDAAAAARRNDTLLAIALDALRDGRRVIDLDEEACDALATWPPAPTR